MICSSLAYSQDTISHLDLLNNSGKLIYSDSFEQSLEQWVVEKTDQTKVGIIDGSLDIDDGAGVTES